jgi:hypothetical protein
MSFSRHARLRLHPRTTAILPTAEISRFLGYDLLGDGGRRLPEENVARLRGRLRGLRDRWRAGTITLQDVDARIGAWIAHAEHADTWRCAVRSSMAGGSIPP